jgi:hypothetical protein
MTIITDLSEKEKNRRGLSSQIQNDIERGHKFLNDASTTSNYY